MDGDDLEDADEDDDDDDEGATGQFRYQVECDPQCLNTRFLFKFNFSQHRSLLITFNVIKLTLHWHTHKQHVVKLTQQPTISSGPLSPSRQF